MAISIDGVLVAPEDAKISIFDRGFLYGDGVFEVLRTWNGRLVLLDAHLDRLYASAGRLLMRAMTRAELVDAVNRTLASAGEGEQRVRIVLTRGPGSLAARLDTLGPGRAIVVVEPLGVQPTEVSVVTLTMARTVHRGASHKTLAYLDHIIARGLAAGEGADEALLLGHDGEVLECSTANIFAVGRGTVVTPPLDGVLPGITRARVIAACREAGIAVRESRLTVSDLAEAEEIFITSSLRGVVAVTRFDGEVRPAGAMTARIARLFRDGIQRETVASPASI